MTLTGKMNTNLMIYQFENLKIKNDLRFENCDLRIDEAGHTSLKLRAAGIEAESLPRLRPGQAPCVGKPRELVADSPVERLATAAQKNTNYSILTTLY